MTKNRGKNREKPSKISWTADFGQEKKQKNQFSGPKSALPDRFWGRITVDSVVLLSVVVVLVGGLELLEEPEVLVPNN